MLDLKNCRSLLRGSIALLVVAMFVDTALAQTKLNVIVIISDDAGYADFGFTDSIAGQGYPQSLTPNLDALAQRGVTFSRAYVAANCQPTRVAIVTGGYQQRVGAELVGNTHFRANQMRDGVPFETDTIWDRLKSLGYSTGAVGKWHLGQTEDTPTQVGNRPHNQGVDEFYGIWHSGRDFVIGTFDLSTDDGLVRALRESIVTERNPDGSAKTFTEKIVEDREDLQGDYITNTFGDYAVDFIKRHAADAKPFMLYQSFTAVHAPWKADSPDFDDPRLAHLNTDSLQYRKRVGSMLMTMDKEIGRILDAVDDPDGDGDNSDSISDQTLIIFVNDNGGAKDRQKFNNGTRQGEAATDNGILKYGKGSPYEGGIRVPMIIAGAGVTARGGSIYHELVHGVDILPTVFAAAGGVFDADEAKKIDGVNLLPFINGEDTGANDVPHEVLVHRWRSTFAVVKADFKLVNTAMIDAEPSDYEFFNLKDDIGETTNLIGRPEHAEIVDELKRHLTDHEAFFDKGRYAYYERSVDGDPNTDYPPEPRNVFDHFVFRPGIHPDWSGNNSFDDDKNFVYRNRNWLEAGTTNEKALYDSDAFAGAVLEFGTHRESYTSNNDLLRQTGGDFMLNKIILSGDSAGVGLAGKTGTIQGNRLLFTNDLNEVGPQIAIEASRTQTNDFSFVIDNELVMYDDLSITGDGNARATIKGVIGDYYDPRNLIKTGTSKVTLTAMNTYAGDTRIEGGTLALTGDGSLRDTKHIEVKAGATLDVSGRSDGTLSLGDGQSLGGSGEVKGHVAAAAGAKVAPGSSFGKLTITNDVTFDVDSILEIELGPGTIAGQDYDQLCVSGTLTLAGGDLQLLLDSPSSLRSGDEFQILQAGTLAGTFGEVRLPPLANGLRWDSSELATAGRLRVTGSVPH